MTASNPYIGLRYFDEDTADRFFGRDEYVADLVEKIEETRFLAVLGHSGSGKSSLVRAGLIPALRAEGGGEWVVAKFRPEDKPIALLGKALDEALGQADSETDLRRGPLGIVEAFERSPQGRADGAARLLVLADQFEELFSLPEEEAAAFVRLWLHANRHPRIYVALTMRSDYLKDCARYRELPERINRGIYLVPRMKRDELELAIVGPARGAGVELDPPLVQRLLNDAAGPSLDQLPLIEHLLARIWEQGASRGTLTLDDYDAVGGWDGCLSDHANELYGGLQGEAERRTCELAFRRLTFRDEANRDVRSRATMAELIEWCGGDAREAEVRALVTRFSAPDAALLTVGDGKLVDVTHESLIRNWTKLQGDDDGWIQREKEARETFRGLERRSRRVAGQRAELKGSELTEAEGLVRETFSEAWVGRYFPGDTTARERVAKFVKDSRWENRKGFAWRWGSVLIVIGVLSVLAFPTIESGWRTVKRSLDGRVNPKDGLRYVYVPSGEFQMGCSPGDSECDQDDEKPQHPVTISKGFWIGQTEVTQAAYEKLMNKNPSNYKGADRPVDSVTWDEAAGYCKAAGLRLPTEAEWEYAARAGSKEARYGNIGDIAWYRTNTGIGSQPVGAKQVNRWGLYDTLGNVWEWTNDRYDASYYKSSPSVDPAGPVTGERRVLRGGSWGYDPGSVRVSYRNGDEPAFRGGDIGFRCGGELP